jgi:hypothetical protein
MREIRTSGSMSGDGKRSVAAWPKLPRPSFNLAHPASQEPSNPATARNLAPGRDCFSRVVSVLEGILVTLRSARGHPAVHSAAAVRHRR